MMGMVARPLDIKPFMGDTIVTPIKEPVQTLKGDIAIKILTTEPVCTKPMMGAIAIGIPIDASKIDKSEIKGRVVNEQGEPIPFASIETEKAAHGLMADENGLFVIKKSWLKKGNGISVSSVGFETEKIVADEEKYQSGELYIQLKANVVLGEVVITSLQPDLRCLKGIMGGLTVMIDNKIQIVAPEKKIHRPGGRQRLHQPVLQHVSGSGQRHDRLRLLLLAAPDLAHLP